MQVLEDDEQQLRLALAQQLTLDGIERALSALREIESPPGRVLHRQVERRFISRLSAGR